MFAFIKNNTEFHLLVTFLINNRIRYKHTAMTLKDFKEDFRMICTDTWGDALESWFECAGQMYSRFLEIPAEWEYNVGAGDGMDADSYFHEIFLNASDSELIAIGNFLFRYCEYLRFKGINY